MSQTILRNVNELGHKLFGKKILIVRGKSYESLQIKNFFDQYLHVDFTEFTPNPLYEQVVNGVSVFNNEHCDIIVAVGGGSAIDVAKCIKLYAKMNQTINYLEQETFDTGIPLIAVPTTAGTGSESTKHAVIYYQGVKQSINHESLIPDIAVLDPTVLLQLPVYQKKCTMLDALCQAVESWWSIKSTDESKKYCREAVRLIKENGIEYVVSNNIDAASKIMDAANYAGKAINITTTTAAHAMSYKITSLYGLPHGHAVAVCLIHVWKFMLNNVDRRGSDSFKGALNEMPIDINWFVDFFNELEMWFPVARKRYSELELLTTSVNPIRLSNNPIQFDAKDLRRIYEEILK